jgi:leucyl aminopeptidase (aminopeptidase T)
MNKLYTAARKAIYDSLKVKKGEKVLLVTDRQKMNIAEALAHWCRMVGAETTTYLMTETLRPIDKPTKIFEEMIKQADVTIYMLEGRVEEKPFRGYMVANGRKYGRLLMMPGITVDMMERLVNVDFTNMINMTRKLTHKLKNSRRVHVTNPYGTDIRFMITGRSWEESVGDLGKKGHYGNLPTGETFTAPVEHSFNGKVVLSLIDDKVGKGSVEFKKGKVVKYQGKGVTEVIKYVGKDQSGLVIGEFGIGTNKGARICKNMLEAEKAFGTCHFAIGDSYGLGKNKSRHHYDMLVDKATIVADGKILMKNGKFMV